MANETGPHFFVLSFNTRDRFPPGNCELEAWNKGKQDIELTVQQRDSGMSIR